MESGLPSSLGISHAIDQLDELLFLEIVTWIQRQTFLLIGVFSLFDARRLSSVVYPRSFSTPNKLSNRTSCSMRCKVEFQLLKKRNRCQRIHYTELAQVIYLVVEIDLIYSYGMAVCCHIFAQNVAQQSFAQSSEI